MIRRRRPARYPPAAGTAVGDTEALQTDVMRFMAIIGLCLMAIFALVQVIPVQEPGKPAPPSQAARLREEIRAQQQQLRMLQAELQTQRSAKARTQQGLTVAQQQLEQLAGQTQQAHAQRERVATQLETLERQLEQGNQALTDLEAATQQKTQNLDTVRGHLRETRAQLKRSRRELETLQHRARQQAAQPAAKPAIEKHTSSAPAAKPAPKPLPAKQGFTLRFASAAALDRLVTAGSVTLYGMADQQAWRLSMDAGRPATAQASFPQWFHEMSAATVPAHYLRSLENTANGPAQSSVVWGVQLPAATKEAIAALTRGQPGGALVIRSNGQVILEESQRD